MTKRRHTYAVDAYRCYTRQPPPTACYQFYTPSNNCALDPTLRYARHIDLQQCGVSYNEMAVRSNMCLWNVCRCVPAWKTSFPIPGSYSSFDLGPTNNLLLSHHQARFFAQTLDLRCNNISRECVTLSNHSGLECPMILIHTNYTYALVPPSLIYHRPSTGKRKVPSSDLI